MKPSNKLCDWLPWGGLLWPTVIVNKDLSMMSVLHYDERRTGAATPEEIMVLCKELLCFPSGWAIWMEREKVGEKEEFYLTLLWNPFFEKGEIINFPFTEAPVSEEKLYERDISIFIKFEEVVLSLAKKLSSIVNAEILQGEKVLAYLRATISQKKIGMPSIPIYLDAYLSQDVSFVGKETSIEIDQNVVRVVSPLGFVDDEGPVISYLKKEGYKYRYVRRFLFANNEDAKKEEEKYAKRWCANRGTMLQLLEYGDMQDKRCGLYSNTLILYGEEIKRVVERWEAEGVPVIVENYNLKDVWLGSIPGIFRANIVPPMIMVEDISSLISLP